MRPRYEARLHKSGNCWGVVALLDGHDDGVPVTFVRAITAFPNMRSARDEAARLNATADGLHRIGVAVAVWAGMAAAGQGVARACRVVEEHYSGRALRMRRLALDLANALRAERADRRKWELRLRWRAQHGPREDLLLDDRCHNYLGAWARANGRSLRQAMLDRSRVPIAGPRGVLP